MRSIVIEGVYVFGFLALILGASFVAAEFATGSMGTVADLPAPPASRRLGEALRRGSGWPRGGSRRRGPRTVVCGDDLHGQPSRCRPAARRDDGPGVVWQELARAVVAITLGGLGGAVIGFLLRSTAGVIGAVLGWVVVVEGLRRVDPCRWASAAVARADQPRRLRQRRNVATRPPPVAPVGARRLPWHCPSRTAGSTSSWSPVQAWRPRCSSSAAAT